MKKILILFIVNIYILTAFAQISAGYYDSAIGLEGDALKSALHFIIDNHTEYSYDDVWDGLKYSDEDPDNSNNVLLLYTGWSYPKNNNGGGVSEWNREHTWAKSHGDFGTSMGAGTDMHHLRPTDVTVNSARGNLHFDNGGTEYVDPSRYGYSGSFPTGCYRDGDTWEPRNEVKGDVARIIFYMATRYEGDSGELDLEVVDYIPSDGSAPEHALLSTLLVWHVNDPVSDWEIRRNNRVHDWQDNRNPFIDHPEWVECIWGYGCGVQNPDNFIGTAISETQIDLSWTLNDDSDDVVLAYNTTNTFGTPTGTYTAGQNISGGGEVLYIGNLTSFNHQSLTTQTYYYKIWSINSEVDYSSGIETNVAPLLPEPANNVTDFDVSDETSNTISLTWTDAVGGELPEAYLVKASVGGITPPVDGTPEDDGQFVKNITYGTESVSFSGLIPSTTYFFEIYPYTNSGSSINYKTNSVESAIGSTLEGSSEIIIEDFTTCLPTGWTVYSVESNKDWQCGDNNIEVNAYGGDVACNDWLITPAVNLDTYSAEILTFQSWTRYTDTGVSNPEVKLKYSVNYSGSGNPESADWTEISYNYPSEDSENWTLSGDVDMSTINGSSVYIAFVYTSSGTGGGSSTYWKIDDVILSGSFQSLTDSDSEALAPVTQIPGTTVSSLNDTEPEAVQVFTFQIEDKGTSDGEITQVLNMRIYPGVSNTADWTDHIQALKLNNGSDLTISSLSITDTYINMLIEPIDIADGTTQNFTLSVWLNTSDIEDGSVLSFMIDADNHGFVADNQFSKFATIFSFDIISADFVIDVEAIEINLSQQAVNTLKDIAMSPAVVIEAVDENGNIDIDFNTAITISSDGTMTGDPVAGIWNSGIAEFSNIIHTEAENDLRLFITSGYMGFISNLFDIYCNPVDVSNLNATCGHAHSEISWTNPDCFDELILVVSDANIIGTPVGTYTANSTDYTDELNPDFPDGGKVVYNGTDAAQMVTGLTNGTNYYFKTFVNSYNMWSIGVETNCMPVFVEDISRIFKLYPNPVKDILTIENVNNSETYTIELYDITGKQILKIISDDEFKQIPLNSYRKGLYIMQISTKKGIYIEKIMIE